MRNRILYASMVAALASGCATTGGGINWDVQPTVSVHHGMAQARAYYQVGRYLERNNRLEAAERVYRKAISADNTDIDAINALGALLARMGRLEEAVDTLKRVEALAPRFAYLHNNLGYTYLLKGDHEAAIAAFKEALVIDPGYVRAWNNLERAARESGDVALAAHAARRSLGGKVIATTPSELQKAPALVLKSTSVLTSVPDAARHDKTAVAAVVVKPVVAGAVMPETETTTERITMQTVEPRPLSAAQSGVTRPLDALSSAFRLEVSNGNGVRFFATRYSKVLRNLGQNVLRVTNHQTFSVEHSVIVYQPGFSEQARALNERLALGARLELASVSRHGTDVRLILGRDIRGRLDALIRVAQENTKAVKTTYPRLSDRR